jgi:hypothetical protein
MWCNKNVDGGDNIVDDNGFYENSCTCSDIEKYSAMHAFDGSCEIKVDNAPHTNKCNAMVLVICGLEEPFPTYSTMVSMRIHAHAVILRNTVLCMHLMAVVKSKLIVHLTPTNCKLDSCDSFDYII